MSECGEADRLRCWTYFQWTSSAQDPSCYSDTPKCLFLLVAADRCIKSERLGPLIKDAATTRRCRLVEISLRKLPGAPTHAQSLLESRRLTTALLLPD